MISADFYEKVSYRDRGEGRLLTVYLAEPREHELAGVRVLVGVRVSASGEDQHVDFIAGLDEIVARQVLELDLRYGALVPWGTAKVAADHDPANIERFGERTVA